MDYIDFQKNVIEKLKSVSLKNEIRDNETVFQKMELMKIICCYVEKYEDRVSLLKKMLTVVEDEKLCDYLRFTIGEMENELKELKQSDDRCVFELHIRDTPEAYDERYICRSFGCALSLIDEFCKEYSVVPDEKAIYEIVKRKIYDSTSDSFSEDFIISCTLDYEKNICSIFSHNENSFYQCDGLCFECGYRCIENTVIKFPPFVTYKDLVFYENPDKSVHYGISWDEPENQGEDCYIIPLDCNALRYRKFEDAHNFHEHIPYTYVEKADEADLTGELKEIYNAYMKYLEMTEKNDEDNDR